VRKIGPKKAVPMLEKYGNLEGIYENIDKLSELPGVGKTLIQIMKEDKELAFLSRSLAKIERNLDFPFSLEELQFEKKEEALREIFQKLEFKSFLKRLGNEETKEEKSLLQGNLFSASPRAEKESRTEVKEKNLEKKIIKSFEELKEEMEDFSEEDKILLLYDRLGITCTFSQKNLYLPFFHEGLLGNNLDLEECKQFFSTLKGKIYTYHLKELYKLGFSFSKPVYDMMIAYHLVSSQTKEDYTLIGQYYLKKIAEDEKTVFAKQKLESLSAEVYGDFLLNRAGVLYSCLDILEEDVKEKELEAVLWETELPLIPVLADMERIGIKIDRKYFEAYSLELTEKLALLEKAIWEEAGEEFNLNSPKQLGEILFLKLNLPTGKKTKTGFSTDVEVLEHLSSQGFQIASNLLEYRKLAKLKNTYVDPIPKMTGEGDRIHTCYHQIGTVTGRLSSSDPNLQNIPVKTEEGIRIRQGFIAREGWKLLSIDYSQVELRVLASLSKDENLLKA
ncbi:DNA polymerase, partial [uncultured Fusobacterium sp.]|uniref:DNA polymerase n=1 Tax=uncultured Fusobacterium sp. TaxID=159267 RepID=UPI0025975DEB